MLDGYVGHKGWGTQRIGTMEIGDKKWGDWNPLEIEAAQIGRAAGFSG